MTQIFKLIRLAPCALMIAALALAGCNREKITVHQVPKDSERTAQPLMSQQAMGGMPANPHAGMDMGGTPAQSHLKWTLPDGWKEKPVTDGMRVGSFDAGKEAKPADVSIIPLQLGGGPQMELANYNLWRESLQLEPADKVSSEPVTVGSAQG